MEGGPTTRSLGVPLANFRCRSFCWWISKWEQGGYQVTCSAHENDDGKDFMGKFNSEFTPEEFTFQKERNFPIIIFDGLY